MLRVKIFLPFVFSLFIVSGLVADEGLQFVQLEEDFTPFTGKCMRDNVRLRLRPNTESPIVKELISGEMFVVDGIYDGFYRVRPASDHKSYVFRSFVLDGVVEGNRVNVRLEPDLDSPVLAQLNTGDQVEGQIASLNTKWLEIPTPKDVCFWVAEDFVEKVGDEHFLARHENRRNQASELLAQASKRYQEEMAKGFEAIQIDPVYALYNKVINAYPEFETHVARAKEMVTQIQDEFLHRKLAYLEGKAQEAEKILQQQKQVKETFTSNEAPTHFNKETRTSFWKQVEKNYMDKWLSSGSEFTEESFVAWQKEHSQTIHGIVEPYLRPVKNKPGDYLLFNEKDLKPIAYLYSVDFDLQNVIGREVDLVVVERPNNHFAYPAYVVIDSK